jgi:hypothetical protein
MTLAHSSASVRSRVTMRTSWILCTLVLVAGGGACSSSSSTGGAPADAGNPRDTATGDTAVDGAADAAGDAASIAAVCTAQLLQMPAACQSCLALACMTEASDCCKATSEGDGGAIGCLPLAACALRTKCVHAACNDPSTCQQEVSGAGGSFGEGTNVAAALGACIQNAAPTNASCAGCLQ